MINHSLQRAQAWVANETIDLSLREEIQELIRLENFQEIEERFYKDLEFGTGGMRSIRGAGTNRINKMTIGRASQALANVILQTRPEQGNRHNLAISYDSRIWSLELSQYAAGVFAANGIEVHIYQRLNPVALLSYSVRHHHATAGIMITASHNPPEYNGYKVFWSDGAQVTPPQDELIIDQYNLLTGPSMIKNMDFEDGLKAGHIHWVGEDIENLYLQAIKSKAINPQLCQERGSELHIIYTPIHGSGLIPCERALRDLGSFQISVVPQQAQPDGNFPTVSSPNPENPEALKLAVDLMYEKGADIVMGSDPDTDRLGVAIVHQGECIYLNGNQLGILFLHYICENLTQKKQMPQHPYFVKTIVTTPLQEKIAKYYGVEVFNTLTGFKWICGKMNEIEKNSPEKSFLFATEESFGYLNHDFVRDKDGVSAVSLMAEIALWYKVQGLNLIEALDKIYEVHGFSNESLVNLVYEGKAGAEKISRIMELFRKKQFKTICGSEVLEIEDYKKGEVVNPHDGQSSKLLFPASNVIGINFKNGDKFYLRPSGTEPKIKFYIMIQENEGDLQQKKQKANKKTAEIMAFLNEMANMA